MGKRLNYDLIGKTYNKLTIVKFVEPVNNRNGQILCRCECGKEAVYDKYNVVTGHTVSCGCVKNEILRTASKLYVKKDSFDSSFNLLYNSYKRRASSKQLDFDLTKEDVKYLTGLNCHYCGVAPNQVYTSASIDNSYTYNGIDRIDNDKGYILDNCLPCCKTCNYAKRTMSYNDFLIWITKVYSNICVGNI